MHSAEKLSGLQRCRAWLGAVMESQVQARLGAVMGAQVSGANKHLHDVVQLCEIHFERLTWGNRLIAVGSQGLEEVIS